MRSRRSIKCIIEPHGEGAVRKSLHRDEPPWPFYMRREIAIYRAFAKTKLPVRAPKMIRADAKGRFIVLERVVGEPLAQRRHVVPRDRATWKAVIDLARAIGSIKCSIDVRPTREDTDAMRARLLEDPTAPVEWIASGLRACARRKLIAPEVADDLANALKMGRFQHGDLLLRNVMRDDRGLVVVDWECAGFHAEGWDAALLSVFAPAWARRELARGLDARSYHACFVFALLRELVFRSRKKDAITARLEDDLDLALSHRPTPR